MIQTSWGKVGQGKSGSNSNVVIDVVTDSSTLFPRGSLYIDEYNGIKCEARSDKWETQKPSVQNKFR